MANYNAKFLGIDSDRFYFVDENARANIDELEEDIGNLQEDISDIQARVDNVIQSVTATNSATATTDGGSNVNIDVSYITTGKATGSTVGMFATAEGTGTTSSNVATHAEGTGTQATNVGSHSEGGTTIASGMYAHAEGDRTNATNKSTHAEGEQTTASGANSHAEGVSTSASGTATHAEGRLSQATGLYSHAEGDACVADANYSHAEGSGTSVSSAGVASHAEGLGSTASGANGAHAGGNYSQAIGNTSFAHGDNVIANNNNEVALGKFNASSTTSGSRSVFSIGNGMDNNNRSNIFEIREDGTVLVNNVPIGADAYFTLDVDINDLVNGAVLTQYSSKTPSEIIAGNYTICVLNIYVNDVLTSTGMLSLVGESGTYKGYYTILTNVNGKVTYLSGVGLLTVMSNVIIYQIANLPVASANLGGVVKVGNGLSIDSNGVLSVTGSVTPSHNYSTTEQVVGTWIDGKPVYEITYATTSPATANVSENLIDISALNVNHLIELNSFIEYINQNNLENVTFGYDAYRAWLRGTAGSVVPKYITVNVSNATYLSQPMYITLKYTKTTD